MCPRLPTGPPNIPPFFCLHTWELEDYSAFRVQMPSLGQAFVPPSTVRFAPVMYDASGPANYYILESRKSGYFNGHALPPKLAKSSRSRASNHVLISSRVLLYWPTYSAKPVRVSASLSGPRLSKYADQV